MPLLYGEREKAFFRLQLEIIRNCDDESIFAWTTDEQNDRPCGMFASWPSAFVGSGHIWRIGFRLDCRLPWTWTNKGLELRLLDYHTGGCNYDPMPPGRDAEIVPLGCFSARAGGEPGHKDGDGQANSVADPKLIAIRLQKLNDKWQRIFCYKLLTVSPSKVPRRRSERPTLLRHYYIPESVATLCPDGSANLHVD